MKKFSIYPEVNSAELESACQKKNPLAVPEHHKWYRYSELEG